MSKTGLKLTTVKQYYVSYAMAEGGADEDGDLDFGGVGGGGGAIRFRPNQKLPTLVQAISLIEAVAKIEKYLIESQLATQYQVRRIEENGNGQMVLV